MKSSQITISELRSDPGAAVRETERQGIRGVTRGGRAVVFMVSRPIMESILETMELQKNPGLMDLVKRDKAGRVKFKPVPDEDAR